MLEPSWKCSVISCLVSFISVLFTQFTLFLLPLFLPASSFITLLPLSAVLLVLVVGLGKFCKRIAGVRASAPAFVLFSIFFIWAVYISMVRQVISSLVDIVFNIEIILLLTGLWRVMSSDPGFIPHQFLREDLSVQSPAHQAEAHGEELKISTSIVPQGFPVQQVSTGHRRVKYCRHCKKYVLRFDHHCPAFGNCIGQRNHVLFIVLLVGFVMTEGSFILCATRFIGRTHFAREATYSRTLVLSSMLFCLIQLLWQVVFIAWHAYCACLNITTDEWINWSKYPEFVDKSISLEDKSFCAPRFMNPYDKGILSNFKELLTAR